MPFFLNCSCNEIEWVIFRWVPTPIQLSSSIKEIICDCLLPSTSQMGLRKGSGMQVFTYWGRILALFLLERYDRQGQSDSEKMWYQQHFVRCSVQSWHEESIFIPLFGMLVQMLGLVVLATVVGGDNCAVEPKLMQLLHWEQSGDTLVPVLHEESLVGNEMLARHVKISTLFFLLWWRANWQERCRSMGACLVYRD